MRKALIVVILALFVGIPAFGQSTAREEAITLDTRNSKDIIVSHKAFSAIMFSGTVTDSVAQASIDISGKTGTMGFKTSLSSTSFFAEISIVITDGPAGKFTATFPQAQWATNLVIKQRFYGDLRLSDFGNTLPSVVMWVYPSANSGTEITYISPVTAAFETNGIISPLLNVVNFGSGFGYAYTTNGGTNKLTLTVLSVAETDPLSIHLDGSTTPSANIPFGDFLLTGWGGALSAASASWAPNAANSFTLELGKAGAKWDIIKLLADREIDLNADVIDINGDMDWDGTTFHADTPGSIMSISMITSLALQPIIGITNKTGQINIVVTNTPISTAYAALFLGRGGVGRLQLESSGLMEILGNGIDITAIGGDLTLSAPFGSIEIDGTHITVANDNSVDIGTAAKRVRKLWVHEIDMSPSTFSIGGTNFIAFTNGAYAILQDVFFPSSITYAASSEYAGPGTTGVVMSVAGDTGFYDVNGNWTDIREYPVADSNKVGFLTITQAVNLDQMEIDVTANNAKVGYTLAVAEADGFVTNAVPGATNTAIAVMILATDNNGTGTYWKVDGGGGGAGSVTDSVIPMVADMWPMTESSFPDVGNQTNEHGGLVFISLDETTEEWVGRASFYVPPGFNTNQNVLIPHIGYGSITGTVQYAYRYMTNGLTAWLVTETGTVHTALGTLGSFSTATDSLDWDLVPESVLILEYKRVSTNESGTTIAGDFNDHMTPIRFFRQ